MSKPPEKPAGHTYDLTLTIRSPRPYTRAELEHLASWWVYIAGKDGTVGRQVKVENVEVKKGVK